MNTPPPREIKTPNNTKVIVGHTSKFKRLTADHFATETSKHICEIVKETPWMFLKTKEQQTKAYPHSVVAIEKATKKIVGAYTCFEKTSGEVGVQQFSDEIYAYLTGLYVKNEKRFRGQGIAGILIKEINKHIADIMSNNHVKILEACTPLTAGAYLSSGYEIINYTQEELKHITITMEEEMGRERGTPEKALIRMAQASQNIQKDIAIKIIDALSDLGPSTGSERYREILPIVKYLRKESKKGTKYSDLEKKMIDGFQKHKIFFSISAFKHIFTHYEELKN